eukprot:157564-Rhodomonas_salina.6
MPGIALPETVLPGTGMLYCGMMSGTEGSNGAMVGLYVVCGSQRSNGSVCYAPMRIFLPAIVLILLCAYVYLPNRSSGTSTDMHLCVSS